MRPLRPVLLVLLLVAPALPVLAAGPRDFYAEKQRATTPEAYSRAARSLREVAVGMSEGAFLETMKMAVLARRGKAMDVKLDGYLAGASRELNLSADAGTRHLVFGYREAGAEVPCTVVVLRRHRVVALHAVAAGAAIPAAVTARAD